MTDYKAIADRAVAIIGSADQAQYQTAYDVMAVETANRAVTETVLINEAVILAGMGVASGGPFIDKLAIILHPAAVRLLQKDGIDVTHPESKAAMTGMLAGGAINQAEYDWVASFYNKSEVVWPGLKPGHVQNALEYRAGGKL